MKKKPCERRIFSSVRRAFLLDKNKREKISPVRCSEIPNSSRGFFCFKGRGLADLHRIAAAIREPLCSPQTGYAINVPRFRVRFQAATRKPAPRCRLAIPCPRLRRVFQLTRLLRGATRIRRCSSDSRSSIGILCKIYHTKKFFSRIFRTT